MVNLVFAGFLAAHGLVHALYLTPRPLAKPGASEWPFDLAASWLVTRSGVEIRAAAMVGTSLVALTVVGFALSALAALGWIIPSEWWGALVVGSAVVSAALLGPFFHPYLIVGLLIDGTLLWVALVVSWNPA